MAATPARARSGSVARERGSFRPRQPAGGRDARSVWLAPAAPRGDTIPTQAEIGEDIGLNRRAVADLVKNGVIDPNATMKAIRLAYMRHLRGRAAGHVSEDGLDLTAERARLARAQSERIELELAETRGEIVRAGLIEGFIVRLLSAVTTRLRAVPAKAAPEAHGAANIAESAEAIRAHQHDALEDVTEVLAGGPPELRRRVGREAAERRRRTRQRAAPAERADGARVGRRRSEAFCLLS